MVSSYDASGGYRAKGGLSPAAMGGVVAVHVLLGAAILNMTTFRQVIPDIPIMWTDNIPADPPKPVQPPPQAQVEQRVPERHVTAVKPDITLPADPVQPFVQPTQPLDPGAGIGTGPVEPIRPPLVDPVPPVLRDARVDARYAAAFQPPYPAAMIRQQVEGDVTVRVSIDAEGRVTDVVMLSAVDPAFFEATRKQALARWRFVPATRDGVPIASERVMTVHFKLTD